jgi:TonB family protein
MKIPRCIVPFSVFLLAVSATLRAEEKAPAAKAKSGYTVTVEVEVNEDGVPQSARLISSDEPSTGKILSKLAMEMAGKTKLPPRMENGHKVKFKAREPFFFPIEGDEGAAADLAPKPRVKNAIQPVYPPELAKQDVSGGAILEFVVDAEGKLARVTLMRASLPEFGAAALEAFKKWTFSPAIKDDKPVESRWRIAIAFETAETPADWPWRVAPRPSFGSWIVLRAPVKTAAPAEQTARPDEPARETPPALANPNKSNGK